ncbi:MAG: hypothetical protein V1646_05325 [bacterium]
MSITRQLRLGIYVFGLGFALFQWVNAMGKYNLLVEQQIDKHNILEVQKFMYEYKRGYPEPSLYSLEAGLDLLKSGMLNLYKENELVADLLKQAEQLHKSDPTGVEKLIWRYYSQLMPGTKELFEKWVHGQRRCYRCKVTTACFILGTIIFSCSGFVMQLLSSPESIGQLGYCDVDGHDGLFPVCFTRNDTL